MTLKRRCVLALFIAAGCAPAQVTDGSLAGYLLDTSQQHIGGAAVVVSNSVNGFTRRVVPIMPDSTVALSRSLRRPVDR